MTDTRKPMRSNFEPGSPRWAVRRAQWRALGLSDADMEKPKIAVVNTSSELSSCFSHLDGVAAEVKRSVRKGPPAGSRSRSAPPLRPTSSPARAARGATSCPVVTCW